MLGICGGYQLLGAEIRDPEHVESAASVVAGLGLLPVVTTVDRIKTTRVVSMRIEPDTGLFALAAGVDASGYEIHHGVTDGRAVESTGRVAGTYLHGLFDAPAVRRALVAQLAAWKGITIDWGPLPPSRDVAFDAIADHVCRHVDVAQVLGWAGLHA